MKWLVRLGILTLCFTVSVQASTLVVDSGQVLELWGEQSYDSVVIKSGGTLLVPQAGWNNNQWEGGWLRLVTGALTIEQGGYLNADAAGYNQFDGKSGSYPSLGTGEDSTSLNVLPGGGGYGGTGGHLQYNGYGGNTYGTAGGSVDYAEGVVPQMGSRGGNYFVTVPVPDLPPWRDIQCVGGAGGGGLEIISQSAIVNGTISANGGGGTLALDEYAGWSGGSGYGSGGGSGGQIVLDSSYLRIGSQGSIQATGGNTSIAGAGGGGRVKLGASAYLNAGGISVSGGTATDSDADGRSGTVLSPFQSTTYYRTDFETTAGPEWSHSQIDTTPVGNRKFLGQFGNDDVKLTLDDLPGHERVTVEFDLYIINSWDGDFDPDRWSLSVEDGPMLLDTTFSNHIFAPLSGAPKYVQSYPDNYPGNNFACDGAVEHGTLGYSWGYTDGDSVYHLVFTFDHIDDDLALIFSAAGLQQLNDESWGLDNVEVHLTGVPEPATISMLGVGLVGLLRRRKKIAR